MFYFLLPKIITSPYFVFPLNCIILISVWIGGSSCGYNDIYEYTIVIVSIIGKRARENKPFWAHQIKSRTQSLRVTTTRLRARLLWWWIQHQLNVAWKPLTDTSSPTARISPFFSDPTPPPGSSFPVRSLSLSLSLFFSFFFGNRIVGMWKLNFLFVLEKLGIVFLVVDLDFST